MDKVLKTLERLDERYGKWLTYFVLIPFLYPRGFAELSDPYKDFFTLWLYLAMAVVILWIAYDLLRNGWKDRWLGCAVTVYYLLFAGTTVLVQGGISEGLQKLFSAPALYYFCFMSLKRDSQRLLAAVGRILAVILSLNISVFAPPIAEKLMKLYHVHFLGHVQVGAQYGIVGVTVAYLLLRLHPQRRDLGVVLLGTSVITLLWSGTVVGALALAVIAAGSLLLWTKPAKRIGWIQAGLRMDSRWLLAGQVLLSVGLLIYAVAQLDTFVDIELFTLNGRTFVWRDGVARFLERPLLGYGAYGVKIETFWKEAGMNYAHSELLQRLLDGGILLCVAFYGMLWVLLRSVRRAEDPTTVAVINILLAAVLMVMVFESVTEYHYITVFFALAACLPEVCCGASRGDRSHRDGN